MRCYLAQFTTWQGSKTFSEIWGENRTEAVRIARQRGHGPVTLASGERKELRPSVFAGLPGGLARADVLHSICYLSFIAAQHKVATAEELTGDGSPLHELAHYLGAGPNIRGGTMRQVVMDRILWLESIIPGMPPKDAVLRIGDHEPRFGMDAERDRAA